MLDLSKVTFPLSLVIGDVKLILIGARPTIEYVMVREPIPLSAQRTL